jgi:orotidine-5'-phosphate decarboxylase
MLTMPEPKGKEAHSAPLASLAEGRTPDAPVLVVAADCSSAAAAFSLADKLAGLPVWIKVGLELFTAEGPLLVRRLAAYPFALFLDLKFHDIPNTVQGAVRSACTPGVRMLSLHIGGGEDMCRAAVAGRDQAADFRGDASLPVPLLMGVTVLTSQGGDAGVVRGQVVQFALVAKKSGLDGVVCSGLEAEAVKRACGPSFLCLCPGIRFSGGAFDDQSRICSPGAAVRAGADFLVMGRPITQADDPAGAVWAAVTQMRANLQTEGAKS